MRIRACIYAFSVIFALFFPVLAQEFRASIAGQVTDSTGAIVDGATVVVTSVERNTSTEATTNSAGRYLVQFLLPGHYNLSVEKPGFKKFVRPGISLEAADHVSVNVALELGELAQSVTVEAEAPLLETETASRASTIENRTLENNPTNGRNLFALQYTLPGALKTDTYWGSMELYAYADVNGVTINGGRSGQNETLVDGLANTKGNSGVSLVPSLAGTQEFAVRTNTYDAQYGRFGGGVTSIVVKSGTNAIHGELYEFLKNIKLDATEWVLNREGTPRTQFENNTFGFELDGPVYIPKLADGRNRLFFMFSYEGEREHSQGSYIGTMPTAPMLQGDFSGLLTNTGKPVTIYDPTTVQQNQDGSYARTPFPGNRIPGSRINPIAAKLATFYPQPNRPGAGPDNRFNYSVLTPGGNTYTAVLGKMDYRVSSKSSLSFRYGQTPYFAPGSVAWGTNAAEPSTSKTQVPRNWGADWTYILSPSLLFNLRGGLARYEQFGGSKYAGGYDPRQLGFPSSLVSQFTTLQFPRFDLGTYAALGVTAVTRYETDDTWSLQPNMSWVHGRHTLKFGAEFRLYNQNILQPGLADGRYIFAKNWTQANPQRGDALSGNEFASFLLGLPNSGSVDRNIDPSYQNKYYALFAQEDWKVTPNLTLNLGLRWDYEAPIAERHNRMVRGFAFDQASPLASQVPGLNLKGGLLYAASSGGNRLAFNPDHRQFQPRVGFAWRFRPKWVMRGGYGLTYLAESSFGQPTGFSQPTPLISSIDNGLTPAMSLSDPFPTSLYPNGLLKPIGSSLGLATNLGQAITAQYLDRPLPYSQQYSFGFERELRGVWLVDASYVGNLTKRLPVSLPLNFIPASVLNGMPVDARPAYFNAQVPNPMKGLLPNSSLNGATLPRQKLLVAYPQYSGVTITDVPIGSERYDSFQSKLTRRFSRGLSVQASFTISKNLEEVNLLNPQDVNLGNLLATPLEKRLYQFDAPRSFAIVTSYELPFGRGKRFGNSMNRVLNGFVGGWNVNTQWSTHSGFPWDFPNAAPLVAQSAKFDDAQRDALAQKAGRTQFDPSYDKFFNTALFPNDAQAPFTLQNFPSRFPDVRGKILNVWEISVFKEFPIKERLRWQIRADFHNAFNHPWFGAEGSNDVTDSRFGQVLAQSIDDNSEPRLIVLVMKIVF